MLTNETPLKAERHFRIRKLIEQKGQVLVGELSQHFEVSEATIRRDLEELASQGWIQRSHGGAVRSERAAKEPPMLQRIGEQRSEKERIGQAAARLIQDGETIFLGSGTTVLEIARHLPRDLGLTVITNSLPVANELAERPNINLIVIGGMLRPSELSFIGHIAEKALEEVRADKVIIGIPAISIEHGLTNDCLPEVMTDRAILRMASELILVADHTKFNKTASAFVSPLDSITTLVTDKSTEQIILDNISELGINLIITE